MKPKSQLLLALCWTIFCLIRIGSRWDELYWFLITVGKEDPRDLPSLDPMRVWQASDAIWWLFGLIFWMAISLRAASKLIQQKHSGPVDDEQVKAVAKERSSPSALKTSSPVGGSQDRNDAREPLRNRESDHLN